MGKGEKVKMMVPCALQKMYFLPLFQKRMKKLKVQMFACLPHTMTSLWFSFPSTLPTFYLFELVCTIEKNGEVTVV